MHRRPLFSVILLGTLLGALFGLLLVPSAPASAHPGGPPQTAVIGRDAKTGEVTVRWKPAFADEYSYLAGALGLLPPDRAMLDGAIFFVKTDADLLSHAPEFEQYLLAHLAVSSGGTDCRGIVERPERLVADGVLVRFACTSAASEATVAVSMLTDLDPAFRIAATGPAGQEFTYSADHGAHDWELPAADAGAAGRPSLGAGAVPWMPASAAVILAAVAAAAVVGKHRMNPDRMNPDRMNPTTRKNRTNREQDVQ